MELSVLSSSSTLTLRELAAELGSTEARFIDVYLLRESDLKQLSGAGLVQEGASPIDALADADPKTIADWINVETRAGNADVSFVATASYFPQLTSTDERTRDKAISAVRNCVKITRRLGAKCLAVSYTHLTLPTILLV